MIRLRMLWSLLIALLLLLCVGAAAGEEIIAPDAAFDAEAAALCVVSQKDPRYQTKAYRYSNDKLAERGCGPCAIANMFIAAFDVTDQAEADRLLLETLDLLTSRFDPAITGMNIKNLKTFMTLDAERFPTLHALKESRGGEYFYTAKTVTAEDVQTTLTPLIATGTPGMFIGRLSLYGNWREIIELCFWLHEEGLDDARIIAGYVSSGTGGTRGPFRTSDGHFVTFLIQPGEYLRTGSIYLLDSLPRALIDEPIRNETYFHRYAFTVGFQFEPFRKTYLPVRLKPTMLRLTTMPSLAAAAEALEGEEAIVYRKDLLRTMQVYGRSVIMVCVPGTTE